MSKQERDIRLDMAKGIAIILVITGHTIQGMYQNFDDSFLFKMIYSFHMPLFFFISGMVMSLKIDFSDTSLQSGRDVLNGFQKSVSGAAVRLLIPFVFWTVEINLVGGGGIPFFEWIGMVIKSPDHSLWFIFALFTFLLIWNASLALFKAIIILSNGVHGEAANAPLSKALMAFASMMVVDFFTNPLGGNYGMGLIKLHYGYFCAGIIYHVLLPNGLSGRKRLLPYLVFIALVPFWYRTHPGPISVWLQDFVLPERSNWAYRAIVALSGILAILDIVNMIAKINIRPITAFLAYCGVASLGIYAFHYNVLQYTPVVIAPLLMSLAFYFVFSKVPVLRTAFFGERGLAFALPSALAGMMKRRTA